MMRPSLQDLAERHACDKGLRGPSNRWSATNYTDVYQAYFEHRRDEGIRLLEIGLGVAGDRWEAKIVHGRNSGGASVKMWRDYFPEAQVTGLDVNDGSFLDDDRTSTFVVDQGSRAELQAFLDAHPDPHFDVIIDDGSHRADHQQISLETLFPALRSGGLYFIEDLNDFGFGGRTNSVHATPDTIDTRCFFRRYKEDGAISQPNAFESTDFLRAIDQILFHCPAPLLRPRDFAIELIRLLSGRSARGLLRREFVPWSHSLLALRKR